MNKHQQNKKNKAILLALILGLSGTMNLFSQTVPTGAINGLFSVSESQQVYFSKGNLQYMGSGISPYWKFADHQWDYLGDNGQGSDNPNVDRDLFGWGTSRWDNGNTYYRPWDTETSINGEDNSQLYGPPGSYSLTDSYANADWGVYNPISNGGNQANLWRSLTKNERNYVFNTRTTSSGIRYAEANVNGVNGVILLPDDWSSSYYTLNSTNTSDAGFTSNTITASQWNTLEQHGAVFLPAAGYRNGTSVGNVGSYSLYWSASYFDSDRAYFVYYLNGVLYSERESGRCNGHSVRLVASAENFSFGINATPNPAEGGTVSGEGAYAAGAECTLTATPSAGYIFINWMEDGVVVSTNASYTFTVYNERNLVANFAQEGNITFDDDDVKTLCVTNWDTNDDGDLSYAEAAVVTSIGTVFKGNIDITLFDELQYFISLASIGNQAFKGCTALQRITIPENVASIGNQAFNGCSVLAEITIPEQVASIGNRAFWGCPALTTVHFNAINCTTMITNYEEVDYSVFMSSGDPATFPLTNLTIGSNVQNIPDYAFKGCSALSSDLNLPNTVATVGQYAFYGCTNLATLTIGEGVETIGDYAFHSCTNLATLTIGEGVETIGDYAFWNCPNLQTVHFNAVNCTSMKTSSTNPNYASSSVFNSGTIEFGATPIVTLTIGENVTRIPECAFSKSSNAVGSLVLPNSVTTIGEYAFHGCSGFTGSLVLPNSVTTIGNYAFDGCSGFTGSLTIGNSVTTIGNYAFDDCGGFTGGLTLGNSVTTIGKSAFAGCSGFTGSLVVPNSVTTIGNYAFYHCSGFTGGLTLGNSVTTIGQSAFAGCSGFTGSLVIPNSVTSIGIIAFAGCSGFTGSLVIPNSVTTIWTDAFDGCSGFTGSLVIPNSVTSIWHSAFSGCSGFDGALILGRNVSSIGKNSFKGCSSFTTLISERATPPTAEDNSFQDMDYSITAYVPNRTDYQSATGWSNFNNYQNQKKFTNDDGDNKWSNEDNWRNNYTAPGSNDVVCITENCQLDEDENANVLYVYIADDEKVLTVNEGKALTTTYGVHIEDASKLVVGNGGQVKSNIPFSGTVQKHINAYTSNNDGWNFIASPVTENQSISGLIPSGETVYDLYYLDEENTYWRNYKVNAFEINHNQGYLYGNQAGTTINFSGALQPNVEDGVSIPLTKEGDGWNLVGNPFTFNAYADKPYYVINGRNVEAAASGAIAPCTGIVVKAEGTANETVKFTKDEPVTSSAPSNGSLQIVLDEANTRGASTGSATAIDNAIVSFNEGTTLPKFRFGDNAQIYIPQNGEDYAIACAAKTGELPLNFKAAKNGEYTLSVNPEDVEMEYLHLIDNMTGADVDLLQTSDYTFNAKTTDYASRFRLVFSANSVDENGASTGSAAFAYINNGEIVITNATADATLQIVDVTGRVVVSVGGHTRCVPTAGMTPGVYVLRLINGNDVKTQKMVIR